MSETDYLPWCDMNQLSKSARDAMKWDDILDKTAGLLAKRTTVTAVAPPDPERIRQVFTTAKSEFAIAGASMRRLMNLFLACTGVSVIVAISGLIIAAAAGAVVAGSAVSTVGIVAMLGLFSKVHQYGRDQALFQFLVSKYELVVSLSQPEQLPALLDAFLNEVKLLRATS